MAVVIRLQGLRITAGSEDIRTFFTGLRIPDGGVHILGGELEEAFIIFESDEDARRAMTRSGGCIKGTPVNLLLSSKSEMQCVLEARAKTSESNKRRTYNEGLQRHEVHMRAPSFSESFLVDVKRTDGMEMDSRSNTSALSNRRAYPPRKTLPCDNNGFYLHLQGLPYSVTKDDVREFFHGLRISGIVLMKNNKGQNNGRGIVKFATLYDASEGLKRDREYIGTRFVEINPCTEAQWFKAGGSPGLCVDSRSEFISRDSPSNEERRYGDSRTRSNSPVAYRSRSSSPSAEEYCVLVENLSYTAEKRALKELFHPVALKDDQIIYLCDKSGRRSRACFVIFRSLRDYCAGLARHKGIFWNRTVYVSPVSKEKMLEMLESTKLQNEDEPKRSSKLAEESTHYSFDSESQKTCLYVRNLPFDVRKVEIMDFFHGFGIAEDSVHLLRDERGVGLGEALVTFQSEDEVLRAEHLNGERFLGTEVMLKAITRTQMEQFHIPDLPRKSQDELYRERSSERYAAKQGEMFQFSQDGGYFSVCFETRTSSHDSLGGSHGSSHSSSRPNLVGDSHGTHDGRGDGSVRRKLGNFRQQFDGPTCLKLVNLPPKITIEEIYDFCYGYRVIPGSVSLQCNKNGIPKGTATAVFETRREAQTAVEELSGRPIGNRKVKLLFI
ncbi:RNA binding motif protein 12Bb [Scleropages formosus]|nr:RNA-binding protein 12B-A-like [Scleropages formosus]XP_018596102.1 RNA-binding protein 12B-A-like [Scleropages formosus]